MLVILVLACRRGEVGAGYKQFSSSNKNYAYALDYGYVAKLIESKYFAVYNKVSHVKDQAC